MKTNRQEEGLRRIALFESFDSGPRELRVDQARIVATRFLPGITRSLGRLPLHGALSMCRERSLIAKRRAKVPRLGIVHAFQARRHAEMENLSTACRLVAAIAEQMRQRHYTRLIGVKVVLVV